ncbi:MAG: hypothetical protein GY772_28770, partial [bacterium]|nr:hypothetical protein [bacterium]
MIKEAGSQATQAVSHLAMDPTSSVGGNAARKLNRVLRITAADSHMYRVKVPVMSSSGARQTMWYPILLPHEEIAHAFAKDGGRAVYLQHVDHPDAVVPGFLEHELVREHGPENVAPLMLFVDAAGFTALDSFTAYLVGSCHSNDRICAAVVRKAELCVRGCRGAHTRGPIEHALAESFRALSRGVWWEQRPDGFPWSPRDEHRERMASLPLLAGKVGALCDFRGDMQQFVDGLGFALWASARNPCFLC